VTVTISSHKTATVPYLLVALSHYTIRTQHFLTCTKMDDN